ncbi:MULTISPECIES: beta-class carbonic anhydrase [Actinokineospora]|uniref:carbonic anhydrase n=1 Tax=Actinokineospora fastidiosa TaxID=1816 RepID=A0A918L7P2_9PSEU|nr:MULTISPECIES: carbonic anhydrase [Actinokineospora]UVS76670.1 Beta-carbonic anhydrase 1 [Actinokineospora sp. UTMC 2448]GGS16565.1 carbonic anhydrase [Actinokineospora fastidiosa]
MSAIDDLLQRHLDGPDIGAPGILTPSPKLHLAVVTCMDARIKVFDVFGLKHGEVHILRNAGGVVTDDVVRSLSISQRKLGTREVIVMQHTYCGLATITDDEFKDELEEATGLRPPWAVEAFREVKDSVRQSVERVRRSPFIPYVDNVRGFVYDVNTAALTEVH